VHECASSTAPLTPFYLFQQLWAGIYLGHSCTRFINTTSKHPQPSAYVFWAVLLTPFYLFRQLWAGIYLGHSSTRFINTTSKPPQPSAYIIWAALLTPFYLFKQLWARIYLGHSSTRFINTTSKPAQPSAYVFWAQKPCKWSDEAKNHKVVDEDNGTLECSIGDPQEPIMTSRSPTSRKINVLFSPPELKPLPFNLQLQLPSFYKKTRLLFSIFKMRIVFAHAKPTFGFFSAEF